MHAHQDDTIATLNADFPQWHVWRSHSGSAPAAWYATRGRPLSQMEYREGLFRTLAADDSAGLRWQLEEQRERESRSPAVHADP